MLDPTVLDQLTGDVDVSGRRVCVEVEKESCRQNWVKNERDESGILGIFFTKLNDRCEGECFTQSHDKPKEEEKTWIGKKIPLKLY